MRLNKKQQRTLLNLYKCSASGAKSFLAFRRRVFAGWGEPTLAMVPWCCMIVGIETDGKIGSEPNE